MYAFGRINSYRADSLFCETPSDMSIPPEDGFFDCAAWQAMLNREAAVAAVTMGGCVGLLRRDDFTRRSGTLLVWSGVSANGGGKPDKARLTAEIREYRGATDADLAMLLVADAETLQLLQVEGLTALPTLVRRGKVDPYMLKTMHELEQAGLTDFIENLGLAFPKH